MELVFAKDIEGFKFLVVCVDDGFGFGSLLVML